MMEREGGNKCDFGIVHLAGGGMVMSFTEKGGVDFGIEDGDTMLDVLSLCSCTASSCNHKLHEDSKTFHVL